VDTVGGLVIRETNCYRRGKTECQGETRRVAEMPKEGASKEVRLSRSIWGEEGQRIWKSRQLKLHSKDGLKLREGEKGTFLDLTVIVGRKSIRGKDRT